MEQAGLRFVRITLRHCTGKKEEKNVSSSLLEPLG